MKKIMKVLSAATLSAMLAVTAVVPGVVPVTKAEAAVSPLVKYDFENGTGMSSSGISGSTAPSVTNDSERGNVLKFAEGTTSKVVQMKDDPSMGEYDLKIDKGTPSSLSFPNPFAGKSLKGITVAYWLKIPSNAAAEKGSGIVGFIGADKTIVHPDKLIAQSKGDNNKDALPDAHGPFFYGISCAYVDPMGVEELPMVYFCGLHHNTFNFQEENGALLSHVNKWVFVTVTQTNSEACVYLNGKEIEGNKIKNKRWNDGEVNGGSEGNVGQPKFTDIISESSTKAYVGFTGYSPTVDGVCIDDLMFFDSALSGADVSSLYTSAQSGEITAGGSSAGSSSSSDKKAAAQAAAEAAAAAAAAKEAAAQAANKALTDALVSSVKVTGMKDAAPNVSGIYRGDAAYTALVDKINSVTLRPGYHAGDIVAANISFGGSQPETFAKLSVGLPNGFDSSLVEIVRINDDGTVSILDKTIENNVITAKTNHFSTYAVVLLEAGDTPSSNLPNSGAVSTGAVVALGTAVIAAGAVMVFRKRKVEA